MDYSFKGVSSAKGDQEVMVLSKASPSVDMCNRSEMVPGAINKPLTFGVDRILACSDKKDQDRGVISEGSFLPQLQFMVPPHIQAQLDISASQGIINGQPSRILIRPQAIRIAEGGNGNNCRGKRRGHSIQFIIH